MLAEKWDYIFYTGNSKVGKIVSAAAAKNLTPVTLELGGKSPLYIDDSIRDLDVAAKRILWGKLINAGQTCIAVDHILVTKELQPRLVEAMKRVLTTFYGEDPQQSADLGRIINANHFARIKKMLDSTRGKVVVGGKFDAADKYIAPTIVTDVTMDDALMQDEVSARVVRSVRQSLARTLPPSCYDRIIVITVISVRVRDSSQSQSRRREFK